MDARTYDSLDELTEAVTWDRRRTRVRMMAEAEPGYLVGIVPAPCHRPDVMLLSLFRGTIDAPGTVTTQPKMVREIELAEPDADDPSVIRTTVETLKRTAREEALLDELAEDERRFKAASAALEDARVQRAGTLNRLQHLRVSHARMSVVMDLSSQRVGQLVSAAHQVLRGAIDREKTARMHRTEEEAAAEDHWH